MENKRVYTHYYNRDNIEYRWRTLIQVGNSWEECGTIFMKNPGSSTYCNKMPSPITNGELLDNLRKFDYNDVIYPREWYEFSVDNTMEYVIKLFEAYYRKQEKPLNGVIQIFNLFNIRGANLDEAIKKCNGDILNNLVYTTDDDINHIISPVYLGWGDLWINKKFRENANKIFDEVRKKTSYLCDGIQNNKYYHPQYLMNYGKNRGNCQLILSKFVNDGNVPAEIDNTISLTNIQNIINSKGTIKKDTINKIINYEILSYEYWCKGKNGKCERENGVISVGLKIDNKRNKYVLSILSNGNHPDKFIAKVQKICDESKLFIKDTDLNFVADVGTDDCRIVDFFTLLLSKMKDYRETDLPE